MSPVAPDAVQGLVSCLSVVSPTASYLLDGTKTIEVRRWRPDTVIDKLLIIESQHYLTDDTPEELGLAVCLVDVLGFHPWQEHELSAARGSYWEPGWIAWELANVRPVAPFAAPARRRIYSMVF